MSRPYCGQVVVDADDHQRRRSGTKMLLLALLYVAAVLWAVPLVVVAIPLVVVAPPLGFVVALVASLPLVLLLYKTLG